MTSKKRETESTFFEFWKMKTFLEIGVGIFVGDFRHVPIEIVKRYIHSQLLIDLFSVFELAINEVFNINGLEKPSRRKFYMTKLEENNLLISKPYIEWYLDWRNDAAHRRRKLEWSELNQAFEDIKKQLLAWKLIRDFDIRRYYVNESQDLYLIGARINETPILEYKIEFINQPTGMSPSWSETVNLSLNDYLKLINEDTLI